jgi:hypothetical protein
VHGCCVKAVKVGATFNGGHFIGRVCAQCSLHSLMRVGVGQRTTLGAHTRTRGYG